MLTIALMAAMPGEDARCDSALERSQVLLQPRSRRIRHPRVLVPFVLADPLLHIGGSWIDRNRHRTRQRVWFLSCVNCASRKAQLFRLFHGNESREVRSLDAAFKYLLRQIPFRRIRDR